MDSIAGQQRVCDGAWNTLICQNVTKYQKNDEEMSKGFWSQFQGTHTCHTLDKSTKINDTKEIKPIKSKKDL